MACPSTVGRVVNRRAVTIVDAEELGGAMTEKLAELFDDKAGADFARALGSRR